MEIATKNPRRKSTLTDRELLEELQDSNSNHLRSSQTEFFERFRGYVFKGACFRARGVENPTELATEITQQTFINAFKALPRFTVPTAATEREYNLLIKAWLGRIANNQFNKECGNRGRVDYFDSIEPFVHGVDNTMASEEQDVPLPNRFREILEKARSTLSERERHIIDEYAVEGCLNGDQRLSPPKLKFLCDLYKTTSENIRQIKNRAFKKLKQQCFQIENE